ncbi:DUF4139 domain-containing protein [Sphingomonas sp. CGMCC 1.13654]|uniref:DUF4139 domain-containing protein n=1 Tax=Sphingomonas chungangi TaxID=2683589 RepID=A0A838L450_9SPHN|nr:DUF4139 domain-containing protein [Sphingomonas chungangi]MBA2933199.1 DUF4139 domain-containing protein [Sphingomonas chungangi]MVW57871.1 DUF4139 domain-containing protein [Sphingomonas chungangi]
MRRAVMASLILAPSMAIAQPTPQDPPGSGGTAQGDLSVTIYSNDLALVQDVRRLDLPSGRTRQAFADVSAAIRPETVSLAAPDATVIEQNFDYDLLSPSSLMQKAVGETITLVRTNPGTGAETTERAKVLAVNGGVVLQVGDKIEVLRDDGLPVRAIFDKVPDSLRARPTLSVSLASSRAGARPVTLSYLSGGLGWSADYVALFDEKAGTIDVQGWVTLRNISGTSFYNAKTLLVAGEVGQSGDDTNPNIYRPRPVVAPLRRAGTETAAREQLGDFYLYPLPERTTIADKQTKQVSFLDVKGAPATSGYIYHAQWNDSADQPQSASSVLKFSNASKGGLGDALPAGTVRVYMRDARGQPQFIGENHIDHTPQGSDLVIRTGDAFDVKVQPTVIDRTRLSADRWRTTMRYTVTNAKDKPVTVELVQDGVPWWWTDTRITAESLKSEHHDADTEVWQVPAPANGTTIVTATYETRI